MIMDKLNEYSDAQTISASGNSTDVVDHGAAGDAAEELYFVVTGINGGQVGGTGTAVLETADDVAFTSPVSLTPAIDLTDLAEPKQTRVGMGLKRYTRVKYVIAAATTDAIVTAGLVNGIQTNRLY